MENNNTGTFPANKYKIDAITLRKAFVVHTLAGLFLCLGISALNIPIWAVVILGSAVMGSYYFQYHKGGQPAALLSMFSDSVYYLGFILTLISLVCSMLFFDIEEGVSSASVVISQFGAAMITTLIGMGIRIYLQNFDTSVEVAQVSARESLDETVKGFNIQMRRTNETLSKLSESLNKNLEETEERNKRSIELYKENQEMLVSQGESSLEEFIVSVEKIIIKSLSKIDSISDNLSEKLSHISDDILELNRSQFSSLNENIIETIKQNIMNISEECLLSFEAASKSSKEFGSSMGAARASVSKLGKAAEDVSTSLSTVEHFEPNIRALEENQSAYIHNLNNLSDEIAARTELLLNSEFKVEEYIKTVSMDYKDVLDNYKQLISASTGDKLLEEEGKLLSAMRMRVKSVEKLSKQWDLELQAMSHNSKAFSDNLVKTAKFITEEMKVPVSEKG